MLQYKHVTCNQKMLPAIYGDIVTGAQLKSSSHISNYQERILKEMCGELMTLDRHLRWNHRTF